MVKDNKNDKSIENEEDLEVTFTGICAYRKNHIHISSVVDEYEEDGQDHALIFSLIDEEWTHRPIENSIGSMCVIEEPKPKVLNMGIDGEITIFSLPGFSTEQVDTSDQGPSYSLHLKRIRKIGNYVYVTGMARQVYKREGPNHWVRMDKGVFTPRGQRKKAVGFNDIDGLREDSIYAVGYKGEIWYFNGTIWKQIDSPTNILLSGIKCISEEEIYACGMAGTLLRGVKDRWKIIAQDITAEDFWGIAYFKGNIYVSNYDGVFVLKENELEIVDMKLSEEITTAYIDANNDVLWSVGHKDLAYTKDGRKWIKVQNP